MTARASAWLAAVPLLAPLAVHLWCWVIAADVYFPGRYETAFVAMQCAIAIAITGEVIVAAVFVSRILRHRRKQRP